MKLRLLAAIGLLAISAQASATSFVYTTEWVTDSTKSTGDTTSSSSDDDEEIIDNAKDDAASFVGSQGEIRGAHLEAAVSHIRHKLPQLQVSDMQLAEAILAH
jgi:uncharacterized protein (TIGR02448 family)